jgi:hypothetical protein
MSFNRLIYDDCAYKHRLYESTSPLSYWMNPYAYESCQKCHQDYPGFLGSLGGQAANSVGGALIDLESDLRNQTRLNSLCPQHKYAPICNCKLKNNYCKNCKLSLPCSCAQCRQRNTNALPSCRPGIVPIESLETRQWKSCSNLAGVHINRFDYLCENPQDPSKVFFYKDSNRLGDSTRNDIRDEFNRSHGQVVNRNMGHSCFNMKLPNVSACNVGGLGCTSMQDFAKGVMYT